MHIITRPRTHNNEGSVFNEQKGIRKATVCLNSLGNSVVNRQGKKTKMIIMNYTKISAITATELAANLLREPVGCIVIDCRSFIAFNSGHIKSAVNICCPILLRRRLKKGRASLETLISCQTTLKFLRDTEVKSIVLYDDSDATLKPDDSEAEPTTTISIVGAFLAEQLKKKTYYLKG